MPRKDLFFLLKLIFLIGFLHIGASYLYLYDRVEHYDSFVHFLGGLWGGSLIFFVLRDKCSLSKWKMFGAVALLGFTLGLAWEVFEIVGNVTHPEDAAFISDTTTDLVMDVIGSLTALFYLYGKRNT